MVVRIGVIGAGMIGQDHIRRISEVLSGCEVVAVTDVDPAKAREVADARPGITVHATGDEVVADPAVDAVVVTSWGPTHRQYVLASIAAGKQVFCEKPLAESGQDCIDILESEAATGRRSVQVGYMRRYDSAYRALKAVVDAGEIGAPLMVHCVHRNPSVPGHYRKEMMITDTAVHEIDAMRWLLGEEIVSTQVLVPRKNANGVELQDPLILLLTMESGAIVDVEISVNIRYGYDIRGEVVGENGTVSLGEASPVTVRREGRFSGHIPVGWRERFIRAYDTEIQEWVDGVAAGRPPAGPSSWDGYVAAVVSEAGLEALRSGARVDVKLVDKPALYT
ncbi:Gfo/Idh/MocA family oxidoreductase [Actinoplanes sp. NPDC051475]|uniref:Gfo/Idh/MocA family protein n=1 Tax=Actinoplanes sp. NPDC051475 TaxID=3157225 RepID=UPI00344DB8D1